MRTDSKATDAFEFGPFRLSPTERLLEKDGVVVPLVGRAMELLICLTETPGEVVSKQALMQRVWPDVNVEDGSLRFHMVTLRKALGEGEGGARYVINVPGRGYSFIVPTVRSGAAADTTPVPAVEPDRVLHNLPRKLVRMVGRDDVVQEIASAISSESMITLVGPGGIGKTTVAVAVGYAVLDRYDGVATFADLGALDDPKLVSSVVATSLGLLVQAKDPTPTLIAHLSKNPMLLVLDNCEHLIDAVASLAQQILSAAPGVNILATSREALRIEDEHIFVVPPLETPPDDMEPTALGLMRYSSAQLFIERITSGGSSFRMTDADVPLVAEICRKLDGMALAIELAAGRVDAYGIKGTAHLLDNRIRLLWHGRRTAPQRHQTLTATLDWSYNLLSDVERRVLDRLSIFTGQFGLDAVQAVVGDVDLETGLVVEAIAGLVAKCLVTSELTSDGARYQLLQTTRAYVRTKASDNEDVGELARRHAEYFRDFLEFNVGGPSPASESQGFAYYGQHIANVRAALEWAFSPSGDVRLAVSFAAAATSLFLELSLLAECDKWSGLALASLDETTRGSRDEMKLQAAYSLSMMFTRGNAEEVRQALNRGIELAQAWGDSFREIQILGGLNTYQTRLCDYAGAIATARRCEVVAKRTGDRDAEAMADWMLAASFNLAGDQGACKAYGETALAGAAPPSRRLNTLHFGYDHRLRALTSLARCLWLRGEAKRATEVAWRSIADAEALDHPLTINIILIYTASLFIWMKDFETAQTLIDRQMAHAEKHSLGPYRAVGAAFNAELTIRQGNPEVGVPILQECMRKLKVERHRILSTVFLCALADGLAMVGLHDKALAAADEAMALFELEGESFDAPEIFRTRAKLLLLANDADARQAETILRRAIDMARRQTALSWELRAVIDLAEIWRREGRHDEAHEALSAVRGKFGSGEDSSDLRLAQNLLLTIGQERSVRQSSTS